MRLHSDYLFHFDVIISKDFFAPKALGPREREDGTQSVLCKCLNSDTYSPIADEPQTESQETWIRLFIGYWTAIESQANLLASVYQPAT